MKEEGSGPESFLLWLESCQGECLVLAVSQNMSLVAFSFLVPSCIVWGIGHSRHSDGLKEEVPPLHILQL